MRPLLSSLAVVLLSFSLAVPQVPKVPDPPPVPGKFFTGAKLTPHPRIIEAITQGRIGIHKTLAAPPQVIVVPKRLSYWGNNQYGVCVSSESAFSLLDFSKSLLLDEIFVTDATVIDFARRHGWLNGANLLEVIEMMQTEGMKDEKGVVRKAGKVSVVNYSSEETLKSAIAQGPVSVAIASGRLPSGAGNKSGWYAFGGRQDDNTDHCVSIHGYGPTSELFKALDTPTPANAPANAYLLYTWKTIGVVDFQWIMSTVKEGWVRNPTVTDLAPTPPPPTTITVICPPGFGNPGVPVTITPTATGGVSPYYYLFDHGDGSNDSSMTHTYKSSGTYTVTVTAVDSLGRLGTGTCVATIGTTPPPPPPPGPNVAGTIQWTIDGKTSNYELMPIGTREAFRKLQDLIGPMAP